MKKIVCLLFVAALLVNSSVAVVQAQSNEELAKQSQNPVADLISIPFQNNTNFNTGPGNRTQDILNIQPVVPIHLSEDWNLITRTIVPLVWQPTFGEGSDPTFGLGNVNPTLFLSPAKSGDFIWGAGPTATFATRTDDVLGSDRYAIGPSAVAVYMPGKWVVGALANNQWSVGGGDDPDINSMLVQYFVNYNFPDAWYFTSAPIITADWEAESSDALTLPFGGGFGKIVRVGKLPINLQVSSYYNAITPDEGADWQLRFQMAILLPASIL